MFLSRSRLSMVAISAVLSIFATLAVSTNAQATGRPPKKVAQATLTFAADTTDQELSTYLTYQWVERRAKVKQTFKDVYGLDWPELLTEAAPYLSARASQLLQVSYQ